MSKPEATDPVLAGCSDSTIGAMVGIFAPAALLFLLSDGMGAALAFPIFALSGGLIGAVAGGLIGFFKCFLLERSRRDDEIPPRL